MFPTMAPNTGTIRLCNCLCWIEASSNQGNLRFSECESEKKTYWYSKREFLHDLEYPTVGTEVAIYIDQTVDIDT